MSIDVALASCKVLPEPDPDAAPLLAALATAGLEAEVWPWDDAGVDWSRARLVLLRSTWNYYLDHASFLRWLEGVAAVTTLHNPAALVAWNTHKRYLLELAAAGVPTAPTALIDAGSDADLGRLGDQRGWSRVVVKPAVSAASHLTFAMTTSDKGNQRQFLRLVAERDMLVQPFVDSVRDHGERSIIVIDGEITHSIRKSPRFGGESEAIRGPLEIGDAERALARKALAAVPIATGDALLYARVDMALDEAGVPMIMELELAEPSLFFAQGPRALEALVAGIRRRLDADTSR